MESFVPEDGYNQGDNVSSEAYLPGCIVVSGMLAVFPELHIPSGVYCWPTP